MEPPPLAEGPPPDKTFWSLLKTDLDVIININKFTLKWSATNSDSSLEAHYNTALDLEKKGQYEKAAKYFKYIDQNRLMGGAWSCSSQNFLAIYREAADRTSLYSIPSLSEDTLHTYLQLREALRDADWRLVGTISERLAEQLTGKSPIPWETVDFQTHLQYLSLYAAAKENSSQQSIQALVQFAMKAKYPRALLTVVNDFAFPTDGAPLSLRECSPYLETILQADPKGRYSDDAAYLLVVNAIQKDDWAGTQKAYLRFIRDFTHDDLNYKNYAYRLAIMTAQAFKKSSALQAMWEIAGNVGNLPSGDSPQIKNAPAYLQAYFRYDSAVNSQPRKGFQNRRKWYRWIADQPEGHPLQPWALMHLTDPTEQYFKVQNQNQRTLLLKYLEKMAERYAYHTSFDLEGLRRLGTLYENQAGAGPKYARLIEKCIPYIDLDEAPFTHLYRMKVSNHPFNDTRLNEMYYLANQLWEEYLIHFPDGPYGLLIFLNLHNRLVEGIKTDKKSGVMLPGENVKKPVATLVAWADHVLSLGSTSKKPNDVKDNGFLNATNTFDLVTTKKASALLIADNAVKALETIKPLALDSNSQYYDEALWIKILALERLQRRTEAQGIKRQLVQSFREKLKARPPTLNGEWEYSLKGLTDRGIFLSDYWIQTNYQKRTTYEYARMLLQNMAVEAERRKDYASALSTYLTLGLNFDAGYLIEFLMSPLELKDFLNNRPDDPHAEFVKYSLGMRLYREGQPEAALLYLADDSIAEEVRQEAVWEKEISQTTNPDLKAKALYRQAQSLYNKGDEHTHLNKRLWAGLVNNALPRRTKEDGQRISRFTTLVYSRLRAGQYFQRLIDECPKSPLVDRALYSLAICKVSHRHFSDKQGFLDTMDRVTRETPQSSLADDALYWQFALTGNASIFERLLQWSHPNDVAQFFEPFTLQHLSAICRDTNTHSPVIGQMFYEHNRFLKGTQFETKESAEYLGSQFAPTFFDGGSYHAWHYFRIDGPHALSGQLDFYLQGAKKGRATVEFCGITRELPAEVDKIFSLPIHNLEPGIKRWLYVNVEKSDGGPLLTKGSLTLSSGPNSHVLALLDSRHEPLKDLQWNVKSNVENLIPDCTVESCFERNKSSVLLYFLTNENKTRSYYSSREYFHFDRIFPERVRQILHFSSIPIYLYDDHSKAVSKGVTLGGFPDRNCNDDLFPILADCKVPINIHWPLAFREKDLAFVDTLGQVVAHLTKTKIFSACLSYRNDPLNNPIVRLDLSRNTEGKTIGIHLTGLKQYALPYDEMTFDPPSSGVANALFLGVLPGPFIVLYIRSATSDSLVAYTLTGEIGAFMDVKDTAAQNQDLDNPRFALYPTGYVRFFKHDPAEKTVHIDDFQLGPPSSP